MGNRAAHVSRRTLRAIAALEAFKGCVAIAASLGILSLLNQDLHQLAVSLIGHIGLDLGNRYPALIVHDVDLLGDARLRSLLLWALAYALLRLVEAYGLWLERGWGEWLGILSGALYVPFEVRHLVHRPTAATVAVIAVNVAAVLFLAWQLWRRRRTPVA